MAVDVLLVVNSDLGHIFSTVSEILRQQLEIAVFSTPVTFKVYAGTDSLQLLQQLHCEAKKLHLYYRQVRGSAAMPVLFLLTGPKMLPR